MKEALLLSEARALGGGVAPTGRETFAPSRLDAREVAGHHRRLHAPVAMVLALPKVEDLDVGLQEGRGVVERLRALAKLVERHVR